MAESRLEQLPSWQALQVHQQEMAGVHMRELFADDSRRFADFSLSACGLLLDYSRNRIDRDTFGLLMDLARERDVAGAARRMFAGENFNTTEQRAVLHAALRAPEGERFHVNGEDVSAEISGMHAQMTEITEGLRRGEWQGAGGEAITDVVNLGIGGAHLGPAMVNRALAELSGTRPRVHFVANVDGADLARKLDALSPATTLFIVNSKSFGTLETMTNAESALQWFLAAGMDRGDVLARHFLAVSANSDKVAQFGIPESNRLPLWDWVGGRYSLWSAVGLPIAIAIGMPAFRELLAGAAAMDRHFMEASPEANMPLILGLLGVWYVNFFGCHSHAVLPYDRRLALLPVHLQQLDMESNGKRVDRDGHELDVATGPLVWGGEGTSGQHAFFQWLHQGTQWVPADFVACARPEHGLEHHHRILLANLLAQPRALMRGRTEAEARTMLEAEGKPEAEVERLLPHLVFPGNRPSNTLMLERLDPHTLGALIALYEHKVFVQGWIWNLNSFDQWGVELGKQMALEVLDSDKKAAADVSEQGLLDWCRLQDD